MSNSILMHQGDSYAIPVFLMQDGVALTADMIDNLEICVGGSIHRKYSDGDIFLGEEAGAYYFVPTQEETIGMKPGNYSVGIRVKYKGLPPSVNIEPIGVITILPSSFHEVI